MQTQTNILNYRVIIQKEKKVYVAYAPALGISDFGKTVDEAGKHIQEAIECHINGLIKTGCDIPAPDSDEYIVSTMRVRVPVNIGFA